jgi:hypothetical protein
MKPNAKLDELLSSFMDGELSPRQRTEVQRMAAHDPAVARRLQQLENCRAVFCSLPPAEAPGDLLEQVREALERKTLLQEQPVSTRHVAGGVYLIFRKLVAAAAMIALLAVLGAVVYQIMSPVPGPQSLPPLAVDSIPPQPVPDETGGPAPVVVVADEGFSGRLELQTRAFVSADVFVRRAIDTCGLVNLAEPDIVESRRTYHVVGTREGVNRLVASLSGVWQEFNAATLHVESPEGIDAPVKVEAVTPDQMALIIASNSTEASIRTAEAYAVANHMARHMPGSELRPLIHDDPGTILAMGAIPVPKLAGPESPIQVTQNPPHGMAQATLTIVLLRTK